MDMNGQCYTTEIPESMNSQSDNEEGLDEADGVFKPRRKGYYCPRIVEMESWGRSVETVSQEKEYKRNLLELLRADPDYRWRRGLLELLHKCKEEEQCHKALVFLYSIAIEGIKAKEKGLGERVDFNPSDAPEWFCCADWLSIIDGLNFVTTSPGTIRDISFVDIQTGANTDEAVLKGFCYFLKCLGSTSWEILKELLIMDQHNGLHLYHTISHLSSGYSMEHASYKLIERLKDSCSLLLRELGFKYSDGQKISWHKAENTNTTDNITVLLMMLFTSADKIETVV